MCAVSVGADEQVGCGDGCTTVNVLNVIDLCT